MHALARTRSTATSIIGALLPGLIEMFGPILQDLISGLLARLLDCDQTADGADAKTTVERNHEAGGRYNRRFFGRVARAARQEARSQGKRISRKESYQLAQATLDHIRTADPTDMTLCIQELQAVQAFGTIHGVAAAPVANHPAPLVGATGRPCGSWPPLP